MKQCEFCAKEISYEEMYCCDECEKQVLQYYERSERFAKPFSMINVVCLFGIMGGMFLFPLAKVFGAVIAIVCCAVLGVLLLLLPFPTESMIKKFKLKKAMKITRIVGIGMMVLGLLIAGLLLIFIL
ncbi:MAG TPA: hypothetical protein DEO32_00910 [Ruminococcaceae bacterium]|nr:hypothetical protein [Oscillospiraceae bacterium]